MKNITIGMVGVGRIGRMHVANMLAVAETLKECDLNIEIVLADAMPGFAEQVGADMGVKAAASVDKLIEDGVDALFIATSTAGHVDVLRKGIAAKLPMFCEKPIASDVPESLNIIREIDAAGATVQVGHQRRFDLGYQEAKRRLDAGDLGWLHSLKAVSSDAFPPPVSYCATSGGLFRDVSLHDFDIIRWLTGQDIVEVYAKGSNNGDPEIGAVGDIDTGAALLTLADGTLATAIATRYNGAGHDVRLDVMGSKDSTIVGLDEKSAFASAEEGIDFPTGESHPTFAERFADAYKNECIAFVELILGERENPCTPADAVAAAIVADAAQLSLVTGEPVKIPTVREILEGSAQPVEVRALVPSA